MYSPDIKPARLRFFDGSAVLKILILLNIVMTVLLWAFRIFSPSPLYDAWMLLSDSPAQIAARPWTLLTYMVTQVDVINLLFNLLWIYCIGRIAILVGGDRTLLLTYAGGGLCGALCFIAVGFIGGHSAVHYLAGPSAALFGVTVSAAVSRPDMRLNLLLLGEVRLKWVAAAFILLMLLQGGGNPGSLAAHIGGIAFGAAYALLRKHRRRGSVSTVYGSGDRSRGTYNIRIERPSAPRIKVRRKRTEDLDREGAISAMSGRLNDADRLDELLDKVRLSGYDSLSAAEKRELNAISSRSDP